MRTLEIKNKIKYKIIKKQPLEKWIGKTTSIFGELHKESIDAFDNNALKLDITSCNHITVETEENIIISVVILSVRGDNGDAIGLIPGLHNRHDEEFVYISDLYNTRNREKQIQITKLSADKAIEWLTTTDCAMKHAHKPYMDIRLFNFLKKNGLFGYFLDGEYMGGHEKRKFEKIISGQMEMEYL